MPPTFRKMIELLGDLRKDSKFTSYNETGVPSVRKQKLGIVGEIYGIPVYWTNAVKQTTGTSGERKNLILHKSAFALAVQKTPAMETDRNVLGRSTYLVGDCLYGVKTVRDDHAVVLARDV